MSANKFHPPNDTRSIRLQMNYSWARQIFFQMNHGWWWESIGAWSAMNYRQFSWC